MAKNTHVLIVLPASGRFFRPTGAQLYRLPVPALACGGGSFKPPSGKLRATSTPTELFWARGIRRSLGLGSSDFVRSILAKPPRQIDALRLLENGPLCGRLCAAHLKAATRKQSQFRSRRFVRAKRKDTSHSPGRLGGQHFDQSESSAGLVPLMNVPLRQMAVFDCTILVSFYMLPQRSLSNYFAQV
jgi:hypothetical protein